MTLNLPSLKLSQSLPVKFNILLDRSNATQIRASFIELPNLQVETSTQEEALENLKTLLYTYYDKLEIIPFEIEEVSTQQSENPWLKFAGVFQDDCDFAEIAKSLIIERCDDDSDNYDPDNYDEKIFP
ncbi:hypothetical protein PCC9214_03145 [Planktothrix tepida]|uniref:Uncharacterized protein n=2 Tax=Planktothrix TaxID=54304 RepID=A0A1J1LQ99_9CYAN|nr:MULTISPECIES: hypothetical protein [Planktothrix]CAD5949954.1 hypothetical protein NO713_02493 [Planktothrix pseudagardhii]CAD5960332.1 hypothetical protein PCC9214_03145 [Planktothrix tepida]CUR34699.1 conserved hypothetical protein [Planktothrix tepida PCC 9214]